LPPSAAALELELPVALDVPAWLVPAPRELVAPPLAALEEAELEAAVEPEPLELPPPLDVEDVAPLDEALPLEELLLDPASEAP
jgi:hypothetical protein